METTKTQVSKPFGADFLEHLTRESWAYVKTVVDVVREPVLILNKDLIVIAANESFYQTFQVEPTDTENKLVYKLGNGQWDISELRRLLEEVLPKNTFFKGFEVDHDFPAIGRKAMVLNARQIYFKEDNPSKLFPPIIMLAIEDVTYLMAVAEKFVGHANRIETKIMEHARKLDLHIERLGKEIAELKQK